MVFCAARAADVLNLFVGVYLVPKYVSTEELGAVQPLASFANFLVIPAVVFATTFRQEISNLATCGEFGRMKSLMRGFLRSTFGCVPAALSYCTTVREIELRRYSIRRSFSARSSWLLFAPLNVRSPERIRQSGLAAMTSATNASISASHLCTSLPSPLSIMRVKYSP